MRSSASLDRTARASPQRPLPAAPLILLYLGARFGSYLDLAGGRTSAACAAEKRTRGESWFTTGEARAVALLVRSQFRDDHRFRMGVLGLLPFTLLYMVMGVRNGAIADPFARRAATLFARRGSSSPARAPA